MTEEQTLACATLAVSNMLLLYLRWKKKHNKRQCHMHETVRQRDTPGYCLSLRRRLQSDDSENFKKFMRMDHATFNKLFGILEDQLTKQNTKWRKLISASDRLALTLRFLATGEYQHTASSNFCAGRATTYKIIAETCSVIWELLMPKCLASPNSPEEWKQVADEFDAKWNFPNCVGVLGGKLIVTEIPNAPCESGDQVMAICDAGYKFLWLAFGSPGKGNDEGIFASMEIEHRLDDSRVILPNPESLASGPPVPHVFVADEHFPLKPHIMKPYSENGSCERNEKIFNYRLRRACRVFDNAFGLLTSRWRILRRPFRATYSNIYHYIKACVCLHNFLLTEPNSIDIYCPSGYIDIDEWNGSVLLGEWRQETDAVFGLQDVERACTDLYSPEATQIRENFSRYFVTSGAIPWQESVVNRPTYMHFSS